MVAWDQAKKETKGDRKVIERLTIVGDTKVRFVGEVLPRYVYWVITKEGKKMPVECLQFNRQSESFDSNAKDPMKELPPDIYSEKPQFAYVCKEDRSSSSERKVYLCTC